MAIVGYWGSCGIHWNISMAIFKHRGWFGYPTDFDPSYLVHCRKMELLAVSIV